jgi:hypothetical protein
MVSFSLETIVMVTLPVAYRVMSILAPNAATISSLSLLTIDEHDHYLRLVALAMVSLTSFTSAGPPTIHPASVVSSIASIVLQRDSLSEVP